MLDAHTSDQSVIGHKSRSGSLGDECAARCDELGKFSETPGFHTAADIVAFIERAEVWGQSGFLVGNGITADFRYASKNGLRGPGNIGINDYIVLGAQVAFAKF